MQGSLLVVFGHMDGLMYSETRCKQTHLLLGPHRAKQTCRMDLSQAVWHSRREYQPNGGRRYVNEHINVALISFWKRTG